MSPSALFRGLRSSRVPGDAIFDAHCHVFNLEYLVLETGQMIWDMLRGAYPRLDPDQRRNSLSLLPELNGVPVVDDAERLLAWAVEILIAAFGSEAANADRLRAAARSRWGVRRLNLVPLMMDIYYLYAPPLGAAGAARAAAPEAGAEAVAGPGAGPAEAEFLERLTRAVETAASRNPGGQGRKAAKAARVAGHGLDRAGIEALAAAISGTSPQRSFAPEAAPAFKGTAGFTHQFRAVGELGRSGSGVYPFFAVDPRRPGSVEWAMDAANVGPKGPFYGVKLYPRMGVHPRCPELAPLFAHCAANSIPVTTHASRSGFPWWIEAYADYGHPENFNQAFEANPGLRIDLAHFGNGTGDDDWGRAVAAAMAEHEGAYSDLACFTHRRSIDDFKRKYRDLPGVAERTMYGSDFDVMYFTKPGITLEEYCEAFLSEFGPEGLGRMACEVPKRFLGV